MVRPSHSKALGGATITRRCAARDTFRLLHTCARLGWHSSAQCMASASQRLAFQCPVSVLRADLERLSPVPQPLEVKIDTRELEIAWKSIR